MIKITLTVKWGEEPHTGGTFTDFDFVNYQLNAHNYYKNYCTNYFSVFLYYFN